MKKIRKFNTAVAAVMLILLTVGMLTRAVGADGASVAENAGNTAELTTLAALRCSGILESDTSFFAYTDFDSWTQTTYTGALDESNPVYAPTYAYGGKFVGLVGKGSLTLSKGAVQFNSTSGGYFDVRLANEYSVDYLLNAFGGKPFVYQADLTTTSAANKTLFRFETRKRNSEDTATVTLVLNLLGYDASGRLSRYDSLGSTAVEPILDEGGNQLSLTVGRTTAVALIVIPSENRYWVAIDGWLTNTDGYALLTDEDMALLRTLDKSVSDTCTMFSSMADGKYFFSDARINPSYPSDGSESFLLDNVRLFRIGTFVGASDYENAATPSPRGTLGDLADITTVRRSGILSSSGSFFLHTGFDFWTKAAYSSADGLSSEDGAAYAPMLAYSGNSVQLAGKSSVTLEDGAVVFNSTDGGYFLVQLGNQYSNVPDLMLDAYGGMPLLIQADVKTASKGNKMLFRLETKKRKADNSGDITFVMNILGYTDDGTLVRYNSSANAIVNTLTDDGGNPVRIDMNGYSTLAVLIKPKENRFWVMLNGVATSTDGYTFLTADDLSSLGAMDGTVDGGSQFFSRVADGEYFPSLVRVNAAYAEGESFLLDNVQIYKLADSATATDYGRMISPFKGATVSMEDSIDLNYYINLNSQFLAKNPGLTVRLELGTEVLDSDASALEAVVRDFNTDGLDETYYRITFPVPAALAGKTLMATLYSKNTVIASHEYSVRQYLEGLTDSGDPATFDAVRSLLNYVSAAEEYFGTVTDGDFSNLLLDEGDRQTVSTAENVSEMANGLVKEGSIVGVSHFSSSISLTSAIEMSHFFTLSEGVGIDMLAVSSDYEGVRMYMDGDRLRIKITGIEASRLDDDYTVTLTMGEESLSLTFSVMSYLDRLLGSGAGEKLSRLALAICDYNRAAELYAARSLHVYRRELVTPATTASDGLVRYTCTDCGYTYDEVAPRVTSVKILGIGNSFTSDSMEYLGRILESAGIEVTLGYLYRGGCSLDEHYAYLTEDNSGKYVYYKTDENGNWTDTTDLSPSMAIRDEDWDVIVLGQAAKYSGVPSSYAKLNKIINLINGIKTNKDARIWWNMTWAFQADVSLTVRPDFAELYSSDQTVMYNAIVDTNALVTVENPLLAGVIPSGTAIQNLRTSYLGDTLTRDGYHLSHSYGRYTAALMWFVMLTDFDIECVSFVPDATALDGTSQAEIAAAKEAIFEAVMNAYGQPMEITDSTVTEAP